MFGVFEEQHRQKCDGREGGAVVNVRWDKICQYVILWDENKVNDYVSSL